MKLSKEVKVGILAMVSMTLFYLGFNFLKGVDFFSSTNTYYVVYDDAKGLTVSNPVLLSGLSVGRVNEVVILQQDNNKIQVEFDLDKSIVIGKGAKATLVSTSLLGGMGIVLSVGDIAQPLEDESFLESAYEIGMVDEIKGKAYPIIDKVDSSMVSVNELLATIASKDKKIDAIIDNVAILSKSIAQITKNNQEDINEMLTNFKKLSQDLNDPKNGLKPLLYSFNQVADSLKEADIKATITNLNSTLAQLETTLAKLNDGQGSVDKLLSNDSLYNNLSNSLYSLDQLLIDMKASPKRYVHFSMFGKKEKK